MAEQSITCPKCKYKIELSEALTNQIRSELESEVSEGLQEREQDLSKKSAELKSKEEELARLKSEADKEIERRLATERKKLEKSAKESALKELGTELEDAKSIVTEQAKQLEEAQEHELALRKRERKLQRDQKALELEMERKLEQERGIISKEITDSLKDKHELEKGDLKKKISTLTDQIDDLKRKSELGSQEAQGEVQELRLEELLASNFPSDTIRPVPKGVKGADVIQEVYNESGHRCGVIVWESKRTKAFQKPWIDKLKSDQRKLKAEIAALYTQAMPQDISGFGQLDGVWITNHSSLLGLATALRLQLVQVAASQIANVGKNQKIELLYSYLSGAEFKGRVESIVEAFTSLKSDLESERRAITKMWAKRDKQIQKVVENTVGMYGDMQGIVGATLPEIEKLDIAALPAPKSKDK
ncbi:MAG: DUF2130 domain-containing protein [Deltaproteobacteria bacterium]|nr:DUF2130 domain-containing protein [Deltaproteobacteria bacterium]